MARTTMTLKNSYLVAKRRKIRVARNPNDMSTFVNLLCTYFMHAQPLEILYIYSFIHFSVLFMYNARMKPYMYVYMDIY